MDTKIQLDRRNNGVIIAHNNLLYVYENLEEKSLMASNMKK
jgi:hypothetical protein